MIERLDVNGINLEVTDDMKKYIRQKIGRLDRYLPRHARQTVHAEVRLKQEKSQSNNKFMCEVTLHLPHEQLLAVDTTLNIFAAIDIVEAKLKNQLTKYKGKAADQKKSDRKGVLNRLRKITDREYWGRQN